MTRGGSNLKASSASTVESSRRSYLVDGGEPRDDHGECSDDELGS